MHHKAFQLHFIISLPFCQKKHIDYHTCANLFNYPAILHLSKCSNRHLKLLPAQNARKYTTPKLHLKYSFPCIKFYYPIKSHYSKTYSFSEIRVVLVLLPYEFTLLQNVPCKHHCHYWVLLSYEFTLLQNLKRGLKLLPVKIS